MNLPNLLTALRIALIPVFVLTYERIAPAASLLIFLVASLTDCLDGYLARKWNQITSFGKLFDPLADKLLLLSVLFCFARSGLIPWWVMIVMAVKELLMMTGSMWLLRKSVVVSANNLGKAATVLFILALTFLQNLAQDLEGLVDHRHAGVDPGLEDDLGHVLGRATHVQGGPDVQAQLLGAFQGGERGHGRQLAGGVGDALAGVHLAGDEQRQVLGQAGVEGAPEVVGAVPGIALEIGLGGFGGLLLEVVAHGRLPLGMGWVIRGRARRPSRRIASPGVGGKAGAGMDQLGSLRPWARLATLSWLGGGMGLGRR